MTSPESRVATARLSATQPTGLRSTVAAYRAISKRKSGSMTGRRSLWM